MTAWAPGKRLLLIIAVALVSSGLALFPLRDLWRNWMVLVGLHAGLTALLGKNASLEAGVAAYLLGVYAYGQVPHILTLFGLR